VTTLDLHARTDAPADPHPHPLADQLTGTLVRPADPDWDEARLAWNLHVDQHPEMVVWAETTEDVVAVGRYAAAEGYRIAAQSTGHGASMIGDLGGVILLKTTGMRGIDVPPAARRARVEAGVLWQDLAPIAAEHGLAGLAGSAGDIGIVGYSLGGGVGWLALSWPGVQQRPGRRGRERRGRAAARRQRATPGPLLGDPWWGRFLRGRHRAGDRALPVPPGPRRDVLWPSEHAPAALQAWRRWTQQLPDSVTSLGRLLEVRRVYDPQGRFHANHRVEPAG
jgi:hypothetical protein